MFKRLLATAIIAVGAGVAGHFWSMDSMPGEPEAADVPVEQQGTALDDIEPASDHRKAQTAVDFCRNPPESADPETVGNACMLRAALADDDVERMAALRLAGDAFRDVDGNIADSLLYLSAARGDPIALAMVGTVEDTDPIGAMKRREALMLAAEAGVPEAQAALNAQRSGFFGQALSQPKLLLTILEGRGLTLPDTTEDRRYLAGVAEAVQQGCPWQAPVWNTAAFRSAQEQYTAPLKTAAHVRLAKTIGASVSTAGSAIGDFAEKMWNGEAYTEAGATFLRDMRRAQRHLNANASKTSESGARDGVRVVALLGGCPTAEGLRFARGLLGVFSARAKATPASPSTHN